MMIEAITRYLSKGREFTRFSTFGLVPRDAVPIPPSNPALTDDQVRRIIREDGGGNSMEAIRSMSRDRAKAARKARELQEKLDALEKAGRIAPEKDFVIVTGDVAKAFPDLQTLMTEGKLTISKVIELVKKVPQLEEFQKKTEWKTTVGTAADDLDWNADALAEVIETKGLAIEQRDTRVEREGKKVTEKIWCVRKAGDDKAEWSPLDEYAETNLKLFLPSLTAAPEEQESDGSERAPRTPAASQGQRPEGRSWPDQSKQRTAPVAGTKTDEQIREKALASGLYGGL